MQQVSVEKLEKLLWNDYSEYLSQLYILRNQLQVSLKYNGNIDRTNVQQQCNVVEEMITNATIYSKTMGKAPVPPSVPHITLPSISS
jgi:hypothetical protein